MRYKCKVLHDIFSGIARPGPTIVQDMIGDQNMYLYHLCCHFICGNNNATKFGQLQEYTWVALLKKTEAICLD